MSDNGTSKMTDKQRAYWRSNIKIIIVLLAIWAAVSIVAGILLAQQLYEVPFFGLPLSFWFAQQGSILVFVVMIFYYARKMDALDAEYDVQEVILSKKPGDGEGSA